MESRGVCTSSRDSPHTITPSSLNPVCVTSATTSSASNASSNVVVVVPDRQSPSKHPHNSRDPSSKIPHGKNSSFTSSTTKMPSHNETNVTKSSSSHDNNEKLNKQKFYDKDTSISSPSKLLHVCDKPTKTAAHHTQHHHSNKEKSHNYDETVKDEANKNNINLTRKKSSKEHHHHHTKDPSSSSSAHQRSGRSGHHHRGNAHRRFSHQVDSCQSDNQPVSQLLL